jgi:hypothetical protein
MDDSWVVSWNKNHPQNTDVMGKPIPTPGQPISWNSLGPAPYGTFAPTPQVISWGSRPAQYQIPQVTPKWPWSTLGVSSFHPYQQAYGNQGLPQMPKQSAPVTYPMMTQQQFRQADAASMQPAKTVTKMNRIPFETTAQAFTNTYIKPKTQQDFRAADAQSWASFLKWFSPATPTTATGTGTNGYGSGYSGYTPSYGGGGGGGSTLPQWYSDMISWRI